MMRDGIEGGEGAPSGAAHAPAPRVTLNPEDFYRGTKDAVAAAMRMGVATPEGLRHTQDASTRSTAQWFRNLSSHIWATNQWTSLFGLSYGEAQIPIQKKFNHRLWSEGLNHITSDTIVPLFPEGKSKDWPNLILTANHARAWESDDLQEMQTGIRRLMEDAWGKSKDWCDLRQQTDEDRKKETKTQDTKAKNILVLACHTERDIFLNGARLIDRRLDLEEDRNQRDPTRRTLNHISPASIRLAKLIFKLMEKPKPEAIVNLDRPYSHKHPESSESPFVADGDYIQKHDALVLREDAARIAQHIKLVGYSMGANVVTDALRFLYQDMQRLGDKLQIEEKGKPRAIKPEYIRTIISNMGVLNINPGEVPTTKAERDALGIQRTTILNRHDLTAGHLVKPNHARYDPWCDALIEVNGVQKDNGHDIVDALGNAERSGHLMDKARAENDLEYQKAQDAVKAFFASNFHKNAITTLCLSHEKGKGNELYIQFAPGVSRADETRLQGELLDALQPEFPKARALSDLIYRRRTQIVLDESAEAIERRPKALGAVKAAFQALQIKEDSSLFIARDALNYLDDLIAQATPEAKVNGVAVEPHTRAAGKRRA